MILREWETGTAVHNVGHPSSHVFLRDVSFMDFDTSVYDKSQPDNRYYESLPVTLMTAAYPFISEWSSQAPMNIGCPISPTSMRLPIKETPIVQYEDTSLWVGVADYGADPNDYQDWTLGVDDGDAIQAALNSGAATIYFNNSYFLFFLSACYHSSVSPICSIIDNTCFRKKNCRRASTITWT